MLSGMVSTDRTVLRTTPNYGAFFACERERSAIVHQWIGPGGDRPRLGEDALEVGDVEEPAELATHLTQPADLGEARPLEEREACSVLGADDCEQCVQARCTPMVDGVRQRLATETMTGVLW